jgi:BirA family biotin operon repressor/biotin-[acetyl-CoA-carboxylase] ligase
MGVTAASLSPELVQRIVKEEIARRSFRSDAGSVVDVFRRGASIGSSMERFRTQGRCMDVARQRIRLCEEDGKSFANGTVFVADELQAGKGRFQRIWHAPPGGLWMTIVLVNTLLPASSRLYPLAAGVACCETIRSYGIDARLKWVNDVVADGKKICGILLETMIGPRYSEEYILVGIGVNVNNVTFPPQLADTAVSMKALLGVETDLDLFAARLLAAFSWWEGMLHHEEARLLSVQSGEDDESSERHPLISAWSALSDSFGRRVLFGFDVQNNPLFKAKVMGLAADGGLILQLDSDGSVLTEHAGEILYLD